MYAGCAQVLREPSRFSKQHLPESRLSFQSEAQEESQHFLRGRDFGETQGLRDSSKTNLSTSQTYTADRSLRFGKKTSSTTSGSTQTNTEKETRRGKFSGS